VIHNLNALCYAGVIYAETAITRIFHSLTFFQIALELGVHTGRKLP